jgi:hypothetical protein
VRGGAPLHVFVGLALYVHSDRLLAKKGNTMLGSYTRLFADEEGTSHFEDVEIELSQGFNAPPAEPAYFASFVATGDCMWIGGLPGWKGDVPHPVPRRMLFVYLSGEAEITASDGRTQRFGPGSVLLAEDTWGAGHMSKVTGSQCVGLAFTLSEVGGRGT